MGCGQAKSGQKKSQAPLQIVQIGGPQDGRVKWIILKGQNIVNPEESVGWEMKFNVNDKQEVSGGINDKSIPEAERKEYNGTFLNGILDVTSTFGDGTQIKYEGQVQGGVLKITCRVIQQGSSGNYSLNDIAECVGPVSFK